MKTTLTTRNFANLIVVGAVIIVGAVTHAHTPVGASGKVHTGDSFTTIANGKHEKTKKKKNQKKINKNKMATLVNVKPSQAMMTEQWQGKNEAKGSRMEHRELVMGYVSLGIYMSICVCICRMLSVMAFEDVPEQQQQQRQPLNRSTLELGAAESRV